MALSFTADRKQAEELRGFFAHCWHVRWDNEQPDWSHYAKLLDALNIPFWAQNAIADLASVRENGFKYLRVIAKERGITL